MIAQLVYLIDNKDNLTSMSSGWDEFAHENDVNLTSSAIVNSSIWNHITNNEVRHIYELLFSKLRQTGTQIDFDFRCDSPTLRRFMHMNISAQDRGSLQLVSSTLKVEHREAIPLLETNAPRRKNLIIMCSWCKKVKTGENDWLEVEDAIQKLNLFGEKLLPGISHGICRSCKEKIMMDF